MGKKWPVISLGVVSAWVGLAFLLNHGPSGGVFGAAVGSTTHRDPIFILLAVAAGLLIRQWWQMLLAAAVIAIGYSLLTASINDLPVRQIAIIGRALSVIVICSAIALVCNLFRPTLQRV